MSVIEIKKTSIKVKQFVQSELKYLISIEFLIQIIEIQYKF